MEPRLISFPATQLVGIEGDGNLTHRLWEEFTRLDKANPIPDRLCADGYEVRVYSGESCTCFVGVAVNTRGEAPGFVDRMLPAGVHAGFELRPINGFDGMNAVVDEWIKANSHAYLQGRDPGTGWHFSLLRYDARYKGTSDPESVVDLWIPLVPLCQSCGMPMHSEDVRGTGQDGTPSPDYCHYCYKGGSFTKDESMEEMIRSCIPFALGAGAYPDEGTAREAMMAVFPRMKRWREAV